LACAEPARDVVGEVNKIFKRTRGKLLMVGADYMQEEQWVWEEADGGVLQVKGGDEKEGIRC